MQSKKIAFIFAFPIRTNPMLITMPFGLNVITLLDQMGYEVDIYLGEYRNDSYNNLFSSRVKVHFLDHNFLWPKEGMQSYLALTSYFKYLSAFKLRNQYGYIFGTGMAGITLAGILKSWNKNAKFIYMNDEFPVQGKMNIWVRSEIKNAKSADIVCTPDEFRFEPLSKQIKSLSNKKHFTLPNTPLKEEVRELETVNWHEYFNIDQNKKLFLMAGGLQDFNMTPELLGSLINWPEEAVLIIKGKYEVSDFQDKYRELLTRDNVILTSENMSPEKLHSLIEYCSCSFCLYSPINDNLKYVGKSSGKLMRSVLLGTPVIVNQCESFQFVEDLNLGVSINDTLTIPDAVQKIIDRHKEYSDSCKSNYDSISFEHYWTQFQNEIFH
jgi:glycosyltransferase involved in cell wall biosynthesis